MDTYKRLPAMLSAMRGEFEDDSSTQQALQHIIDLFSGEDPRGIARRYWWGTQGE